MYKKMIKTASLLAFTVISTQAQAFHFGKPITTSVVVTGGPQALTSTGQIRKKEVTLMNVQLTQKEKDNLFNNKPQTMPMSEETPSNLPASIELGMNGTPVLDQGEHGTCVTFATTAAVDAILGKGDYVSQLCNLELGSFLQDTAYTLSGWDGTFGPEIIDQIMRFGVISTTNQKAQACGKLTEYPTYVSTSQGQSLPVKKFRTVSENIDEYMYWVPLLNANERYDTHFSNAKDVEIAFNHMKAALAEGHRVTFGTILVLSPYCSAGACANYKAKNDTWALTKEIETPPYYTGGHEMVITGYDDDATVKDAEGKVHQGLLTMRNSWGTYVGDQGNYYMTYDYFKKFVMEIQEIAPLNNYS